MILGKVRSQYWKTASGRQAGRCFDQIADTDKYNFLIIETRETEQKIKLPMKMRLKNRLHEYKDNLAGI